MTPTEWQEEACFIHDPADDALFDKWTAGLPQRTETTPYHSQAHCIRPMRMAFDIVKPTSILEIGFCLGHSACIWINLGASVVSVDNSNRVETQMAIRIMTRRFANKFAFATRDSMVVPDIGFDMAFIDGDHSKEGVEADIELCRSLGIRRVLFDDWLPRWGQTQEAVAAKRIVPLAIFGNFALCDFKL